MKKCIFTPILNFGRSYIVVTQPLWPKVIFPQKQFLSAFQNARDLQNRVKNVFLVTFLVSQCLVKNRNFHYPFIPNPWKKYLSVRLSVCPQDYSSKSEPILMKLFLKCVESLVWDMGKKVVKKWSNWGAWEVLEMKKFWETTKISTSEKMRKLHFNWK